MLPAIAVLDDLLFLSRVREAARGAGCDVRVVRRVDQLPAAAQAGARVVVVDADGERLPWREILAAAAALPALAGVPLVAFVSHANAEAARAARAAGASRVLARSAFVQELPSMLAAERPAAPIESEEKST